MLEREEECRFGRQWIVAMTPVLRKGMEIVLREDAEVEKEVMCPAEENPKMDSTVQCGLGWTELDGAWINSFGTYL